MMENMEMQEYRRQLCQLPHMISTSTNNESSKFCDKKTNSLYRTRYLTLKPAKAAIFILSSESSSESEYSDSADYSDWVAEEGVNENVDAESSKRTRRRQINYKSEFDGGKDDDDDDDEDEDEKKRKEEKKQARVSASQKPPVKETTKVNHQLVDTYDSIDTKVDVEILPSSSRMLRSLPTRYLRHASDWKSEAKLLFQAIWDCEDSVPFRTPVNHLKCSDYHNVIGDPMGLRTVRDKLSNDKYETPHEFHNDMRLIFQNWGTYNNNNNKRSRIYDTTVRLAAMFEEDINKLIRNWKMAKRRNKAECGTTSCSSSSELSEIEEIKNVENVQNNRVPRVVVKSEDEENSSSSPESDDSIDNSDDIKKKKIEIEKSEFLTSVSSRGRVRKLNPRVMAFLKNKHYL